ncbi:unnamed protein product [Symbiodinium natans]|uniref:Uncharacterized protein n=1 Tax=Symbiodinium natans TaxID=878477 RepID=A0A812K3J3_9DINO|nr:unnamed protein product [Symbiodinium natans]
MEDRLEDLTRAAAAQFGAGFRYASDFGTSWVYQQLDMQRGNRVSKTVSRLYMSTWNALDRMYPERVVDWPHLPEPRPMLHEETHFHALGRTKPLTQDVILSAYSPQAVRMAAQGNEDEFFAAIFANPPLQMDLTWTRKERKRGLKGPTEEWPLQAQHLAKEEQPLSQIFQRPSTAEVTEVEAAGVGEVYRFDYTEQAVRHQIHPRRLHNRISGLCWNAGAVRQGIDISAFLAGTWSYLAMQEWECDLMDLQRLESLEYSVVAVAESGLAVAMPEDFLARSGQLVQAVTEDLPSGQWALRGIFGKFDLRAQKERT